jgi:hypothetical protein
MQKVVQWTKLGNVPTVHSLYLAFVVFGAILMASGVCTAVLGASANSAVVDVMATAAAVMIGIGLLTVVVAKVLPKPDVEEEVKPFLHDWAESLRTSANELVTSTYPLPPGGFSKYEFWWAPRLHRGLGSQLTKEMEYTVIFAKEKSLLFFRYPALRVRVVPGCTGSATLSVSGTSTYLLDEVYYSGVSSLSNVHEESVFLVPSSGCTGGFHRLVVYKEGFIIRSAENYPVTHDDANEVKACVRALNERMQAYK